MLRSALVTSLALATVACAKRAPQDALAPEGPVAQQADNLFRPVFWIAAAIFFLVEGLLVVAMVKFRRRRAEQAPKQIHGNTRLEILWTIIPAALLAGISIPTAITIFDVAEKPVGANVVHVKVKAFQWWWQYEYTDFQTSDGKPLRTANELVIPTGRWVSLELTSNDVIHSYWVPKLAGKQDVIPGRTTFLKLRAEHPGVYRGQCAEFCALSHANMRLRVIAQSPTDFDRWVDGQREPAAPPTDQLALQRLVSTCAACHTIRGVPGVETGITAPDLTHFASRDSFAGSMLDLVPDATGRANLARWLDDPPAVKPGSQMPDYGLSQAEIEALVAYLMSLE